MSRYALVTDGVVSTVVQQATPPATPGLWIDITGQHVGPGYTYNGSTFAAPVVTYKLIRTEAFWERFTAGELVDYDVAMQHDPAATNAAKKAAARLHIFQRDADASGYRKLGATKVTNFVTQLETDGIIAAGRAATILTTPITADEAFDK